jgi:hypothetical protein
MMGIERGSFWVQQENGFGVKYDALTSNIYT